MKHRTESDSMGEIQVPSDQLSMVGSQKDNNNIIVDTGAFIAKGSSIASFNNGNTPPPVSTLDLLYVAQDVDNPEDYVMNIFISTSSTLTVSNLIRPRTSTDRSPQVTSS